MKKRGKIKRLPDFRASTRREFLRGAAAATLAAAAGCRLAGAGGAAVAGIRIGAQMWSVNDLWKKDPAGSFRRLKAMGYDGVQSFGFYSMDWNELEKMLDGEGLRIIDAPFYMKTIAGDGEKKFLDYCARFGIDFAYEPYTRFKTGAEWKRHAEELVALDRRYAKYGIRVGYHNHQQELREKYDGNSPMEYLYEGGANFELDVGHVTLGGGDPVAWLGKLPNRAPSIHAKPGGGNSVGCTADRNNWSAIFRAAAAAGTKWAIVECEARRNTFEDVEASMRYLKTLEV